MADQRCGTCRWKGKQLLIGLSLCQYPIPRSVVDALPRWAVKALMVNSVDDHDGWKCPCYQPQESTDDE